eukprot:gene28364-37431_t
MNRLPKLGLAVAVLFVIVDQATKLFVTGSLGISALGDTRYLLPIFNLSFVPNHGVSLGLFRADDAMTRWALVALTGAIAIGVLVWMFSEKNRQDQFALGMVLGGAVGNIIDRIRLGYVIDYADLHFGEWRPFLVFNLGDAFITMGVLVLLVRALLVRDKIPMRKMVPIVAGLGLVVLLSGCGHRGFGIFGWNTNHAGIVELPAGQRNRELRAVPVIQFSPKGEPACRPPPQCRAQQRRP